MNTFSPVRNTETFGGGAMNWGGSISVNPGIPWGQELQDQEFHQVRRELTLLSGSVCDKG